MMALLREARDWHVIIPIALMHRIISINTIACDTENFAVTPRVFLQMKPYGGIAENNIIIA